MRLIAVLLIYAFGSILATQGVVFAAALFVWNDIFQPLEFAKAAGRFPMAQYVLAILVASYGLNWFRGKASPRFGAFFFLTLGLMAWILLTAVVSPFSEVALDEVFLYFKYVGPLLVIHTMLNTRKDIKILAAVLAASVGVWAVQAGAHCLVNGANTEIGIPGGQMIDRNDFAAAIVGTQPILFYFLLSYRWRFRLAVKIGLAMMIFLGYSAIIFSLSRGASVGMAASALLYVVYVSRSRIRDAFILLATVGLVLLILPQSWYDRMNTIKLGKEQTEGSAAQRMQLMTGALNATLDNPVFGVGPGGWLEIAMAYSGDTHNPHSIYLVLSSETGIPGLVLYLIVIVYTYIRLSRTISRALQSGDVETSRLGMALIMAIFGLLSAMTFLNRPFNEYLWAWLAVANALPVIYDQERRQAEAKRRRKRVPPAGGAASGPGSAASGPGSAASGLQGEADGATDRPPAGGIG